MTKSPKIKPDLRKMLLYALFFSLPFHPWFATVVIILLFILCLITTQFSATINKLTSSKVIVFLLAYFIFGAFSLLWTSNISKGLSIVETSFGFLLLPIVFASVNLDETGKNRALLSFVVGCLLALLFCVGNAGISLLPGNSEISAMDLFTYENLASGVHMQPIYLAMYFIMAALVSFYLYTIRFTRRFIFFLVFAILFVLAVLMLSSRMEIMALLVICSLGIIKWAKDKGKLKLTFPMLIGLFVVAAAVISLSPTNRARFVEMFDFNSDYTENRWGGRSLRLQKWKYSSEIIADNFIFGVGLGDMQDELQEVYIENDFELGYSYKFNSHNQYVQTALGLGLIGLLAFSFILFYAFQTSWKSQDWLFFSFILLFALSCITESMLLRQKGAIFFAVFLCFWSFIKPKYVGLNKDK